MYESNITTIKLIKVLFNNLDNKRQINIIVSMILMIFTAISEFLLISTFSSFLLAIFNTNGLTGRLENNGGIILELLNAINIDTSIKNISIFTIFITLFTCVLRLVNLGYIQYLSAEIGTYFSNKAFKKTIRQSYIEHTNRNSGELISIISNKSIQQWTQLVSIFCLYHLYLLLF